ncbi:MAG TPA: TetR/AcrR family transcriptional regulator [Pseudonocardia sp.]
MKSELPELGPGKGAQTSRGLRRRGLILKVAATLFAERGFESVSINDIGSAAGITGPAIYRYFASKEALLVSIYEHLYRRSAEGAEAMLAEDLSDQAAIEWLIDVQIAAAIEEPEKVRIVDREERHLPLKEAEQFRIQRRTLLGVWTDQLRRARPDLGRDELDATVHAVLAMINSIALRRADVPVSAGVRAHLRNMAVSLVSVPARTAARREVRTA